MGIRGLFYLYILLVASVSLASYKKGIYLIWLTLLFIPTIILEQWIKLGMPLMTVLMFCSVIMELRLVERRSLWRDFFVDNQKAILAYLFIAFVIIFLSQTVPVIEQFRCLCCEIAMLLFALQTFILVKSDIQVASTLRKIVCWAIVYNLVFCIIFEMIIGINPAGMPLYIILGVDDNEFITDMIDSERGNMSFRSQTVYRHALSLGQYLLVILPLFLTRGKLVIKFAFVMMICFLIVVSGSRGAMVPMVLVVLLSIKKVIGKDLRNLILFVGALIIVINFIPKRQMKKIYREIEPIVASLQFWDDSKREFNDIGGSSMELRLDQFDAALIEIEDNPIFGRGYGYRDYYIYIHNALHPDLLGFESVFLLYLVERGWLGLLFFFIMAYYIYKLFGKELSDKFTIRLIFMGYLLSIIMTGVRPLTLLFVCLTCSIVYGLSQKQEDQLLDSMQSQESDITL